jgi:signal transduction histidine kinase
VDITLDRRGEALQVQVQDTGIGISAEDLPKLFAEFQQLDSSPSRRRQGTGLGLVLTRRLAELHGGSVQVESTPGRGSVFTVLLPFLSGGAADAVAP